MVNGTRSCPFGLGIGGNKCELFFDRWEMLVDDRQANVSGINSQGIAVGQAIPGLSS